MKPVMAVLVAEWILAILLSVPSLVRMGAPWRSGDPTASWLLAAWIAVGGIAEVLLFLLLVAGVSVSPWAFAAVFGALDVVAGWRLWLQR